MIGYFCLLEKKKEEEEEEEKKKEIKRIKTQLNK